MICRSASVVCMPTMALCLVALGWLPTAQSADLSGVYDVGTITPLQRPEEFGKNLYLSPEEAKAREAAMAARMAAAGERSDPNRSAPEAGGRVGGYNAFWVDPGSTQNMVDGKFRTSIISHPENGRVPAMNAQGAARLKNFLDNWFIIWRNPDPTTSRNTGTAWWLEEGDSGPYDNMEQRPLAERCIIGSRSTAGPPMLPNFYNNHKRIIQTPGHVMILTEMNHDARIIRLQSEHSDPGYRAWLGDSVGTWDGDTLVVKTKHFKDTPPLSGTDHNLEVEERFTKQEDGSLLYAFTVSDPTVWDESWGGEYSWRHAPNDKVYEYACHEGNYTLGNVMRGARQLEADAAASGD